MFCLLFKTFSIQGQPFPFVSALTLAFLLLYFSRFYVYLPRVQKYCTVGIALVGETVGAGKSVSFSVFFRFSKRMHFSYPGHPACVCLLFKIFSVQGKPFHFLLALTLAFLLLHFPRFYVSFPRVRKYCTVGIALVGKSIGAGKSISFSVFFRFSKRMYFSYPGHPACVFLLFETFSVQGKPFHFLLCLRSESPKIPYHWYCSCWGKIMNCKML